VFCCCMCTTGKVRGSWCCGEAAVSHVKLSYPFFRSIRLSCTAESSLLVAFYCNRE